MVLVEKKENYSLIKSWTEQSSAFAIFSNTLIVGLFVPFSYAKIEFMESPDSVAKVF